MKETDAKRDWFLWLLESLLSLGIRNSMIGLKTILKDESTLLLEFR